MSTTPPTLPSGQRAILFNAFEMNTIVHQSPGLWRHPEDQARNYNTIGYWTHLAQLLEKGLFDAVFIADVLGPYDIYQDSARAAYESGTQVPVNDPFQLVSAMAAVTDNLGFGVTASTAYEHPYPFSRRIATLDHLTNGRVGWNVVTGYLPSAARNMGNADQMEHDARYDHADEYLDVVYKLLGGSWEDDAVVYDRDKGIVTDPAKVHDINHDGTYFKVPGAAVVEPSTQRVPLIFQAGSSSRGRAFAGKHAEATFVNSLTPQMLKSTVAKMRQAVTDAGRDAYDIRVFSKMTIITGATDEEAQAKHEEFKKYIDVQGTMSLMSGWMGIDLSQFDPDEPIGNVESNAMQSAVEMFRAASGDGGEWTTRKMAEFAGIGGFGLLLVGSGETVAKQLAEIQDETDVDGFNLAYAITPGSFEDIVEHVVPELQKLGRYKTAYAEGSLRQKLFGEGDRLNSRHYGSQFTPEA